MAKLTINEHRRLLAEIMARVHYDAEHRGLNSMSQAQPFEALDFLSRGHRVDCMIAVIRDLYAAGYGVLPFAAVAVKKPARKKEAA